MSGHQDLIQRTSPGPGRRWRRASAVAVASLLTAGTLVAATAPSASARADDVRVVGWDCRWAKDTLITPPSENYVVCTPIWGSR